MPEPRSGPPWELAFSTLGCPEAGVEEVARLASASGSTGVELRCAPPEGLVTPRSSAAERSRLAARLREAGVRDLWVASYARVADEAVSDRECLRTLHETVQLAGDLGALGVRVFPGAGAAGRRADALAARRLRSVADAAADAGTGLLLETHDSHPRGADVARVLEQVDHPAVGAVWDVLHTWLGGETPHASATALAPWLRLVQVKDVASREDLRPLLLGTGALPLHALPAALGAVGYRGPLSLEWEKRWFPEAQPLEHALTHAAEWMRTAAAIRTPVPPALSPRPDRRNR
ncbi:sugar phosphate isomerase/epimerase family protein [Streptomyces sp. NPDC058614]|uniref:sugar phosphate isomerase/epimerase family protein n=1 Tax=Streptomyces sp. NPDC058614 TaxID=3346557 RepID=UPI00365A934A